MATARAKVEALLINLSSHIITLKGVPGTAPEDVASLEQLKTALWEQHTDITREINDLENGEDRPKECMALSRALAKSMQTDNMIVSFIANY